VVARAYTAGAWRKRGLREWRRARRPPPSHLRGRSGCASAAHGCAEAPASSTPWIACGGRRATPTPPKPCTPPLAQRRRGASVGCNLLRGMYDAGSRGGMGIEGSAGSTADSARRDGSSRQAWRKGAGALLHFPQRPTCCVLRTLVQLACVEELDCAAHRGWREAATLCHECMHECRAGGSPTSCDGDSYIVGGVRAAFVTCVCCVRGTRMRAAFEWGIKGRPIVWPIGATIKVWNEMWIWRCC